MSIDWSASLVPVAAVIPAPVVCIKVVAVIKLVVGFPLGPTDPLSRWISGPVLAFSWRT